MNMLAATTESTVQGARRDMSQAVRDYNLAAAHARRLKEAENREREIQDDLEEIEGHLTSDLLNEPLEKTLSATDPSRLALLF